MTVTRDVDDPRHRAARRSRGSRTARSRGLYDVAARPGTDELWVAHAMLGIDTAQPDARLRAHRVPVAVDPARRRHATRRRSRSTRRTCPASTARSPTSSRGRTRSRSRSDGALALVVDTNSEDVLVVDARGRVEAALAAPAARPHARGHRALARRHDRVRRRAQHRRRRGRRRSRRAARRVALDRRRRADPAPRAAIRCRRRCGSASTSSTRRTATSTRSRRTTGSRARRCHIEGRSDAVTWQFAQGPRDTPTNAGGMLGTGFLFRTADRNQVQDYWHTINVEQGGDVRSDRAGARCSTRSPRTSTTRIPLPIPPTTDPALVARGASDLRARRRRLLELPRRAALHRLGHGQPDARSRRARSCCTTSARA